MKLSLVLSTYYRVKRGQTLACIARACSCPPRALAAYNGLTCEVCEGQVLRLPPKSYDLYTVRGGESKTLLCGSAGRFEEKNGTKYLYPAQVVFL